MDLRPRLALAGDALMAMLDPDKDFMPTNGYEVAHDLGRWWDAALRLEATIGYAIPAELEAASLRNLQRLTDNGDALLMNRADVPWLAERTRINPHNLRETLLAFGGLVRRRQNRWAHDSAMRLVHWLDKAFGDDGRIDFTTLACWGNVPFTTDFSHTETLVDGWFDGTATSGRALEALVWLYEATGEPKVIEVARRIAAHHLQHTAQRDGSPHQRIIDPNNEGHNHSYHGTLRGLLLFGLLTGDRTYIDTVEASYRHAVCAHMVKESGWAPHDLGKMRFPNQHGDPVTDPASTGDAAQIALWLALHVNCHDLFDDVERYVRARLIPAQLSREDVMRYADQTFAKRDIGAWAIHAGTHGGKGCTPDVLAAVTHSLCDIQRTIVTHTQAGARVNLHLDFEDDVLSVTSSRGDRAVVAVVSKRPTNVMIRVPGWTDAASVRVSVDGNAQPVHMMGRFAWLSREVMGAGSKAEFSFDLPLRSTTETMPSGRGYAFRWRGDEIVGCDPPEAFMPFYPALV